MRELILLVDPKPDTLAPVESELSASGYEVQGAGSWTEAIARIRERRPDALITKAPLREGPVEVFCRQLRRDPAARDLPLLVLSRRTDSRFRERVLEAGADDVVGRPFHAREIVLRIRSLLRRAKTEPAERKVLCVGTLRLDVPAHQATADGQELPLTVTEFRLLAELARHWGRVCSREELLQSLWAPGQPVGIRAVDTQVRRIRRKLGPARHYLGTIRGFGYCLADPDPA